MELDNELLSGRIVVSRDFTTGSQYDTTGRQHDSTGSQHDSTGSQYDSTGSQYDSTGSQYDSTGSQYDSTGSQYDCAHGSQTARLQCLLFGKTLKPDMYERSQAMFRVPNMAHVLYYGTNLNKAMFPSWKK
jgi:hypothetical protein